MRAREYGVLLVLALIWGASFLFIKLAVEDIAPATMVVLRLAFSVATLLLIVAARPGLMAGWRRYWRLGLLVGILNNAIPFVLIAWGETTIASGVASILNATTPLFTVLMVSWLPGKDRESLTLHRGVGVLLGFAGVAVLIGPAALNLGGSGLAHVLGELAVLIAAAAYGAGAILSKRFGGSATLVAPLSSQVAALVIMIPVAMVWSPVVKLPSPLALGAVAELGILGTALAYLLYFWLIHHVGATRTSLVTYLLPCTALLWGVLFLQEHVSWNALAGLLLVLVGTMITNGTLSGLAARKSAALEWRAARSRA